MEKTREGTHCVGLVCVIHIVFLHVAYSCPDGLIERMDGSCCKPVHCDINQGFKTCSMFDSADSCYDCPSGTINRYPFNTADYSELFMNEICVKIDCDCLPEAELQNSEECKINGKKDCVCKRWELYYGKDPALCLGPLNDSWMLKLLQQPGYELKIDGKVAECDKGYYKNSSDNAICRPHSKCPNGSLTTFNGSTTQDITCQRVTTAIPLTTTTIPLTTTTSPLVTMAIELVNTTLSRAYQSTSNTSEKTIKFAVTDVKKHETHNIIENITSIEQPESSAERQNEGNDVLIIILA
uniref:Uncharacterized protein LOC111128478 n=1 Tax=Crassostrea virginica TaxID=6565 RepID=A0A8B8DPS2_CRAVI|nr:uncharacterized protein LOC111128478 [Crassostrea virginica]XP_022329796.1 uncharacterized protein LOC111128478 [Crassostrea virginica]